MGFASGLVSQLGWAVETTAGTAVTVSKFQPHISEGVQFEVNRAQGEGLYGSTNGVALLSRHVLTTKSVSGDFEVELTDKSLGTLWRAALGSTTTPSTLTTGVYQSVFQPGDQKSAGSSLTLQVGRPQTDGTVKPFTWNGVKISGFEFGGNVIDPVTVKFDIDGWTQTTATALATASYSTTQEQFTGAQLTVAIGGTASTTGSVVSISGSTALTGVTSATIKGENPLATDRYYANASGIKAEQLVNGLRTYEVELEVDFISQATLYDLYVANTTTALKLTYATATSLTGSNNPTLEVIIPAAKITKAEVNAEGPDVLAQKVTFTALYDGTNAPFQIRTVNTDAAL
jgi:hypothetical protein